VKGCEAMHTNCSEGCSDCVEVKHSSFFKTRGVKHWNRGPERLWDPYPCRYSDRTRHGSE